VADQLRAVDTSVLDRLVTIRQEDTRLEEYRGRAEQMKGNVSELVYRRVIDDYKKRHDALEQQAMPLRTKARAEYRKLRQLVDHISRAFEQAKLEKEELEFRHAVGELDDERLAAQLQAPQRVLDECQADMACIDGQKARFVEAMGSEAALETPAPSEAAGAATARADIPVPSSGRSAKRAPERSMPGSEAPSTPPSAPSSDATMMVADPTRMIADGTQLASSSAAPAEPPPSDDTSEGQTILVPLAALIAETGTASAKEYRLGAVSYLGRAEDNQIQITSPGVSRKHAVIMAAPQGFSLKDLGSQNGVSVNGQRVSERTLMDGDRVEIGGVPFVFRSPWPTPAPKVSSGDTTATGRAGAKS
jgi:hypothetical protein